MRSVSAFPTLAASYADASGSQRWQYQDSEENRILFRALTSRACVWQLLLTACGSCGVHILVAWGSLSDWNDHRPVDICLFGWTHPDGYDKGGTSISETMPVDAFVVAFVVCLGAMKRMGDVQRGWVPHVPSTALHRGPLWLLFPRGSEALPRLSSLLGVTVVWATLWGGLALCLLSIAWASSGCAGPSGQLCMKSWTFIISRACWSTTEAVLVSAGSFLLWCSKGEDVASRSLVERARLRREADDADARKAAGFFGWFQAVSSVFALGVILLAVYTWYVGCIGLIGFTPTAPGGVIGGVPTIPRPQTRDAAQCRAMPRDAAQCRAMPRDAARCRAMRFDALRCVLTALLRAVPWASAPPLAACSTPPDLLWIGALVFATGALLVCALGLGLARYHQARRAQSPHPPPTSPASMELGAAHTHASSPAVGSATPRTPRAR